jgi:hypothetical protein
VTTKERINQFIAGRVFQKNWNWFYDRPLAGYPRQFVEGMDVAA